jgi:cytoplasmic tRNA 2-thiolation protein 2
MAMLDMLLVNGFVGKGDGRRADKTKGEKEVVWDQGTTVYVEFAGVTGMDDRMEGMREMAERNGLRFVGIRAEEVFDPSLPARLGAPAVRANGAVVDLSHPGTCHGSPVLQFTEVFRD